MLLAFSCWHLAPALPERARPVTTRRTDFSMCCSSVGFVSTAAAIVYPVSRFLVPPATGEPVTNAVSPAKAAALKPNAGIVSLRNKAGHCRSDRGRQLHALSAVCTHLDCTVQFKPDTSQLWCACHNGLYDLAGNVVSGPPPRSLERFTVNLRGEPGNEDIVVTRVT